MAQELAQQPIPPAEKTPEQLAEELRVQEEEEKAKGEERRKAEEQARIKAQEDARKLEEALKGALSGLAKTPDGCSVAYSRLSLVEKELDRLFPLILRYKSVRFLDLSGNNIQDLSICSEFEHLSTLNASKNQVKSLQIFRGDKLASLQVLNLTGNKLKVLSDIGLPSLRRLILNENEIQEVSWKGHEKLAYLELRKNKLKKLKGLAHLKQLRELYVCENEITDLRGLQDLPLLHKLSLRNNKIKKIHSPFPHLPFLVYLNLRENQLTSLQEFLKLPPNVQGLNFLANPVLQELGENAKKETVLLFPQLTKVNKAQVTADDRALFEKERQEKLAEKERERAEEEARKAEEAEKAAEPKPEQ